MKKTLRNLLSIILSALLIVNSIPGMVYADEENDISQSVVQEVLETEEERKEENKQEEETPINEEAPVNQELPSSE